jgi:glycosyltransferase involved in cell wall biosynthesis
MSAGTLRATVVVCTRDRPSFLARNLGCLAEQTVRPDLWEVVVVDNGSAASAEATVRGARLAAAYVREPEPGLSRARNAGLAAAQGEIVAFLDDDAFAAPGWLAAIRGAFAAVEPRPACVAGKVTPLWETERPPWLPDDLADPLGRHYSEAVGPVVLPPGRFAIGANMAFSRVALDEVGGFDPAYGYRGARLVPLEESIVQQTLDERGYTRLYEPRAEAAHLMGTARARRGWFLRRYYWEGVAAAAIDAERSSLTRGAGVRAGTRQAAWLARSPGRLAALVRPTDDPSAFLERCRTSFALGRAAGYLGVSRL